MAPNQAHKVYAQQQVFTASPAKLVLMCYEQAIASLREAVQAIEENNIEKRWKANNKAHEIISHLWSTLDTDNGGDIAKNLDQLFGFILTKLPEVDFKNNPQPAMDAIKLLEPIRLAWKDLVEQYSEKELAQAEADARQQQSVAAAAAQPDVTAETVVSPAPAAPAASAPATSTPPVMPRYSVPNMPKSTPLPMNGSVSVSA